MLLCLHESPHMCDKRVIYTFYAKKESVTLSTHYSSSGAGSLSSIIYILYRALSSLESVHYGTGKDQLLLLLSEG